MKERITKEKLVVLIGESQGTDLAKKYRAWSKLDKEDQGKLTLLGTVSVDQGRSEEYPSKENYWSPNYPIALEYYPYCGCDIYYDGKSYFLIYQEVGGHASEKRCRSIRKELLV